VPVGLRKWALHPRRAAGWLRRQVKDKAAQNSSLSMLLLVLAAYCLLTVVLTWPVVLEVSSAPAGNESGDRFEYVWALWWTKEALLDLHTSPANLSLLYYPYGADHPLLLSDAFFIVACLPLVLLSGPVVAYNVYFLASFVLTGFATYLLCYSVTHRTWPSFLGGVVFAFLPFRYLHGAEGHVNLLSTFWVPLYVLFLFGLFAKARLRDAVLCGVLLALSCLSTPLVAAHAVIPITILFVLYQCVSKGRRLLDLQLWKGIGLVTVIALALMMPFYYPMLSPMISKQSTYIERTSALGYSADLLSFVVPFRYQLLAGTIRPLQDLVTRLIPGHLEIEDVAYLGLVPLLLACIGVWKRRSRAGFWVAAALVTAVLALGPLLRVGGQPVEYRYKDVRSYVVLPGAVLTELPFYEWIRAPSRFTMATALAVAVLASCGLATILGRVARGAVKAALSGGLVALILLEYDVYLPFPVAPASVPAFYRDIAGDGEDYGLLDVSEAPYNHRGMYYQTVHGHGILRGHAYRIPREASSLIRFCNQIMNPAGDIFVYDPVEILKQWKIKYVVLHKDSEANVEVQRPFLSGLLGESVYEDEQIVSFAVPEYNKGAPVEIPLMLLLGEHWYDVERSGDARFRWMPDVATIYAKAEEGGQFRLRFVVYPFNGPKHLEVFAGPDLIAEYYVGGTETLETPPFTLAAKQWVQLRFHVVEGCEKPSEVLPGSDDGRCLGMLFQRISLETP
jgi:hypothetical protein